MSQPPTLPIMARALTRSIPFITPQTFQSAAFAIAATISFEYDTLQGFCDPNALLSGAFPGTNTAKIKAVGPNLDAVVFCTGAGTLGVELAVDQGCTYRQLSNSVVPANTLTNISGLRVTARFVRVTFTNTSGGLVAVEFGTYMRSV